MSDIDNHNYRRDTSSWDGIRTSLAEMERRLGELQDQLDPRQRAAGQMRSVSGIGFTQAAVGAGAAGAATVPGGAAVGFPHTAGSGALAPGGLPGAVGFVPPPFGSDPAARQSAEEILAQARAAAREVLATAEAQVGLVKEQIEQLLVARETLRSSLRTALVDCESVLGKLERPASGELPAPSQRAPGTSLAAAGAIGMASAAGGPFAVASTLPGIPQAPEVFEGSISLRVGPLRDISQVDTLEIALLQVPGAEQVEVKEFAGRDAVAVIKLFQPVRLVDELRRVLPFQFDVAGGGADALTLIALEDEETSRLSDATGATAPVGVE
jgi:hypothetical protein